MCAGSSQAVSGVLSGCKEPQMGAGRRGTWSWEGTGIQGHQPGGTSGTGCNLSACGECMAGGKITHNGSGWDRIKYQCLGWGTSQSPPSKGTKACPSSPPKIMVVVGRRINLHVKSITKSEITKYKRLGKWVGKVCGSQQITTAGVW